MKVYRVEIDSNVLISAQLIPDGTPRHVLDRLAAHAVTLLFTDDTDLLELDPFESLPILTPAVFLRDRAPGE